MTNRIVWGYERAVTTTVNDIEHIESQTLAGISVVKVFFQPKARIDAAVSQITAIAQTVCASTRRERRRRSSSRTVPPQCRCSSSRCRARASRNSGSSTSAPTRVRTQLATVEGATIPSPTAAAAEIQVDIDLAALQSKGLAPNDVVNADQRAEPDPPGGNLEDRDLRVRD